jgi:hypothetical protein
LWLTFPDECGYLVAVVRSLSITIKGVRNRGVRAGVNVSVNTGK